MKTYYLSVCKNTIRQNIGKPRGQQTPPLRVSRGKHGRPRRYWSLLVPGPVKVCYDDKNPMPWGARVWLEWEA